MTDLYSQVADELERADAILRDSEDSLKGREQGKLKIEYFIYIGIVIITYFVLGYFQPSFITDKIGKKKKKTRVTSLSKHILWTVIISGLICLIIIFGKPYLMPFIRKWQQRRKESKLEESIIE